MIDLSRPIRAGMSVYPGDPAVVLRPALTIERDGVAVTALSLGSHTGTHVDAPAHFVAGARTAADIAPDELCGVALVLHVPGLAPGTAIGPQELGLSRFLGAGADTEGEAEVAARGSVPRIVLIDTGWDQYFKTALAFDHPYLTAEAVAALWDLGMRVLGVDTLSPDRTAATGAEPVGAAGATGVGVVGAAGGLAGEGDQFAAHRIVLGGDGLIVENLRNLGALGDVADVTMLALPVDGDGAPVRAVATFAGP